MAAVEEWRITSGESSLATASIKAVMPSWVVVKVNENELISMHFKHLPGFYKVHAEPYLLAKDLQFECRV